MNFPKEKHSLCFALPFLSALISCSGLNVREELQTFSEGFSLSECLKTYKHASFYYSLSIYEDGESVGLGTRELSFSREEGNDFYKLEERASGRALDAGFAASLTRDIQPSLDAYKETEMKSGEAQVKPVSKDLFKSTIDSFFYTKTESGYASGGVYYGDFIKLNFRYQEAMKIEDDETLVLEYDGLKPKDGQTASIYLKVNKLGLAQEYRFHAEDQKTTMITSFQVNILNETNP